MRITVLGLVVAAMLAGGCSILGQDDKPRDTATRAAASAAPRTSAPARTIGAARPGPRKVQVTVQPGKLTPAPQWPDACSLLTDDEVTAILPDAKKVETRRYGVTTLTIEDGLPTNRGFDETWAKAGGCLWRIKHKDEYGYGTHITVRLRAVGDAKLLKDHLGFWQHFNSLIKSPPGVDACYLEAPLNRIWVCVQGSVMFDVDGETYLDYDGFGTGETWESKVLPMVATTVAAKFG